MGAVANAQPAPEITCPTLPIHETVRVERVVDGDTLRLEDGRRVRLLSVNAPELARDDKPAQPFARASRQAVEAFLADAEFVHLSFESRRTDRYGRTLAHIIHPSGQNLESQLVRGGYAFPLAVSPDLQLAACLHSFAQKARREQLGVWQTSYGIPMPATAIEASDGEFRSLCGRIDKIDDANANRDLWLELEGDLVLRIQARDRSTFADYNFSRLVGKTVLVWGWLDDRRERKALMARGYKPWSLKLSSPYMLEELEQSACGVDGK